MITYHIKSLLRSLRKQKTNAVVNILGLALGLGITLLIWTFVLHERSYDTFFSDHDRIYRVHSNATLGPGEPQEIPTAMFPIGEWTRREHPGVEEMVRFCSYYSSPEIIFRDESTVLSGIKFADENFFSVFDLEFLAGHPDEVLRGPGTIVINESTATRLDEEPLDVLYETIHIQGQNYQITGIFKDLPDNTHLEFNAVSHHDNLPDMIKEGGLNFFTYLRIAPGADIAGIQQYMDETLADHIRSNSRYDGVTFNVAHRLMNIGDIHLHSNLIWEMKEGGSWQAVLVFSLLSVFILFVAIINYVNLATARSMLRAKEIGVRKVSGASRGNLIRQIMTESFLTVLLALIVAIVLAEIFSVWFSQVLGFPLNLSTLLSTGGLLVILMILAVTGLLSGLYPAFYLSSFNPVRTLKGEVVRGKTGQTFRRALVVFQFTITIFVISSLVVMTRQLHYIQNRDLGFDQEEVIILENLSGGLWQSFQSVRARLETIPRVVSTGGANFIYGGTTNVSLISEVGTDYDSGVLADVVTVDHGFLDVMGVDLVDGRNFHAGSEMDVQSTLILNETAVNALGLEDPLGKQLEVINIQGPLIGVISDFHMKSLHQPIEPLVLNYAQVGFPHIYLKAAPGEFAPLIEDITKALREFDPNYTPNIRFLDETIALLYQQEQRTASLLSTGAILAFVISLLGVYGLAAFAAERRVKEMGIRIVLGASIRQLLWKYNRESVVLAVVSMLIAWPFAWLAMDSWMSGFAFTVRMNPLWFILPGVLILVSGALIISIQTHLAFKNNPVEALRHE